MSKRAKNAERKYYGALYSGQMKNEREGFIKGYEKAEKEFIDLAQLWVDSGDANVMSFEQFLKYHETQSNKQNSGD